MNNRNALNEYYIPGVSPVQLWGVRGCMANWFTMADLAAIVGDWRHVGTIINDPNRPGYECCTLVPTGQDKHAQATIRGVIKPMLQTYLPNEDQVKVLVHMVYWRFQNGGAFIPEDLDLSHRCADHTVLDIVAESRPLNEGRKLCHMYGFAGGSCPHFYAPCTL